MATQNLGRTATRTRHSTRKHKRTAGRQQSVFADELETQNCSRRRRRILDSDEVRPGHSTAAARVFKTPHVSRKQPPHPNTFSAQKPGKYSLSRTSDGRLRAFPPENEGSSEIDSVISSSLSSPSSSRRRSSGMVSPDDGISSACDSCKYVSYPCLFRVALNSY